MSIGPHWSERFQRQVWLTRHALNRAAERDISLDLVLDIIETGTVSTYNADRDVRHCWIWKSVEHRQDNLLCIAALLDNAVIVKTVMHHFEPEGI